MAQHTALSPRGLDQLQRHGQIGMGWMRFAAQTIADQDIDPGEQLNHLAGNFAEVCGVTNRFSVTIEAIGGRLAGSVRHLAMANAEPGAQPQPFERIELDQRRIAILPGEHIAEPASQDPRGIRAGIARKRSTAAIAQHSEVIDAVSMVGVFVGPEHRVDPVDVIGEQLGAQIGRGIDQ